MSYPESKNRLSYLESKDRRGHGEPALRGTRSEDHH